VQQRHPPIHQEKHNKTRTMKDCRLKNLLVNFRALFTTNIRKRINENSNKIAILEDLVVDREITERYHYFRVIDYYVRHEQESLPYKKELDYLRRLGAYCNFPYQPAPMPTIDTGFDTASNMAYVIHRHKKLFFPAKFSVEEAAAAYSNYIQEEKILGISDTGDAPHQYQSPSVQVEDGDVVFDIGAAEGLFALDHIEKASRAVIVENDPQWVAALQLTFAPYSEKVTIIQKGISSTDTEHTLSLKTLLAHEDYRSAFIKMDIEGYELPSIASALDFLKEKKGTKLAMAAYHRQHDADELLALLNSIGYTTEFSTGYMLFHLYDIPTPPYFRHGVIRAKK